ncbi:unnamed protein product [Soboliphyme baturini]|uniref:TRP domain-containing protein n=1 Tax=Soboliphyme baturini TaxID=241478 RepID=A0A183IPH6_9BILA|nr:unnamed protein product [Soboliphyme baturini]
MEEGTEFRKEHKKSGFEENEVGHYFENSLANAIRNFVNVQVVTDLWRRRHDKLYDGPTTAELQAAVSSLAIRLMTYLVPETPVTSTTYHTWLRNLELMSEALINQTFAISLVSMNVKIPEYSCPIPCDYDCYLWRCLFFVSVALTAALVLCVLPWYLRTLLHGHRAKKDNFYPLVTKSKPSILK